MPRSTRKAGLVPRFPASHEPPGGASREPCAHLRSKCASRMGGGSRSFILARLELASRHPTNRLAALRGNPALTSDQNALRAWVEAASSRNRSPLQKNNTTTMSWCYFLSCVDRKDAGAKSCVARVCGLLRLDFPFCNSNPQHLVMTDE